MIRRRIFFCEFVTPAFLSNDVNQHGAFQFFNVFKILDEIIQTMAFQWSDICETEFLEKSSGNNKRFQRFLDLF